MAGAGARLKAAIRHLANVLGYDIVGYDGDNARARLARLLARHDINLILDVGANSGAFGWDGGFGCSWLVDPVHDLVVIVLTQRTFESSDLPRVHREIQSAAYSALA